MTKSKVHSSRIDLHKEILEMNYELVATTSPQTISIGSDNFINFMVDKCFWGHNYGSGHKIIIVWMKNFTEIVSKMMYQIPLEGF